MSLTKQASAAAPQHLPCSSCGLDNRDSASFCAGCGRPIAATRADLDPDQRRTDSAARLPPPPASEPQQGLASSATAPPPPPTPSPTLETVDIELPPPPPPGGLPPPPIVPPPPTASSQHGRTAGTGSAAEPLPAPAPEAAGPPVAEAAATRNDAVVAAPADGVPARRSRRRWIVAVVATGALIGLGAGLAVLLQAPPPTPTPSRYPLLESLETSDCLLTPGAHAGDTASQLAFWERGPMGSVARLEVVACEVPHGAEVYYQDDAWPSDARFPGDLETDLHWDATCASAFETYVGIPWQQSELETTGWLPSQETWALEGDRQISCIAYDALGRDLEGSIQGSAR